MPEKRILECSSRGDRRFSALYATVKAFGKESTIEKHYQESKRNIDGTISGKGMFPDYMLLGNRRVEPIYLSQYYDLLWIRYLDAHPELVWFARQFDDYHDTYKGRGVVNCQADTIRKYVRDRTSLVESTRELQDILGSNIT